MLTSAWASPYRKSEGRSEPLGIHNDTEVPTKCMSILRKLSQWLEHALWFGIGWNVSTLLPISNSNWISFTWLLQSCEECLKCRTADCTNIGSMDTNFPYTVLHSKATHVSYGFSTKGISISLEPRLSILDFVLQLWFFLKAVRQNPEQKDWVWGYISIALCLYVLLFKISNLS